MLLLFQVLRNNPEDSSQNATDDKWNWDTRENNSDQQLVNTPLPDLTKQLDELKKDKQDLIGQLEQLDLENQQNLLQIVGVKDKLQYENNDLKQKYTKLKEQHNILLSEQGNLKNQLEELEKKCVVPEKPENMDQRKEKYELQLRDNQNLKLKQEELQKELSVLKSTNTTLQKVFEDFKIATEQEKKNSNETIKQLQSENKIIYAELQQAKNDIKRYEKKSSEDAENCQKLAFILESYDKQVSSLKNELEEKNEILQARSDNDEITTRLKEEIENIKKSKQEEIDCLTQELENLKMLNRSLQEANSKLNEDNAKEMTELKASIENQENVISSLKERLTSNTDNEETTTDLKRELNDLKVNHENVLLQLHNKYVNIITENIRKFQDCDKPSDFQHCFYEDDPQIAEFSKHVEDILKILLDFKCKCEILEEEVYSLSEEKTKILTEKNHEIEKLIQNSEILSQEVITKTQTIKDLENECNELAKNNELLINELENYKNNSGLQTISESNEDNMVLLESQLENANKRIEDLEKIIDDFEEQKQDLQSENELDNAIKQLHITETEISNTQKDYQELLNSFDQLQIEFDNLKYDLELAKENRKFISEENLALKSHLDKLKSEYENTEYQLSEYKINSGRLKGRSRRTQKED
ncbi:hypothetical protein NQ318_022095 [Aromia moschata]|uniref:Uncharacterized protein n=1 Tax=Aromia moschata TaxID=1265417 RepID=A0AAV8Z6K3_9CUCU|nr:hypothetical protein NQ318_022095 [Aromia moschata]